MFTPPFRHSRFASSARAAVLLAGFLLGFAAHAAPVLKVLFLGDHGPHRPADRLREIGPAMMERGLQLVYTEELADLTLENLRRYDALLVYANIDAIPPAQDRALADQMLADPQALAKNYVPPSSDVLFSTPLVNPNESFELNFTAPTQPGRYPIMCTFPGHWRIMQATLVVQ